MKTTVLLVLLMLFCSSTSLSQQPILPTSGLHSPQVAVNPTNPLNLIAAVTTGDVRVGASCSFDRGASWSEVSILSGTAYGSDPVLAVDPDGIVYIAFLDVSPNTGVYLCQSTGGGQSWGPAYTVVSTSGGREGGQTLDRSQPCTECQWSV